MLSSTVQSRRKSTWRRGFVQIAAAALFCVILPFALYAALLPSGLYDEQAQNTALATLAGLFGGFWLNRSVVRLPGTRESSSILTSYAISFGIALTLILFVRIEYSRAIMFLGFISTLIWFYGHKVFAQKSETLVLGVVGGGRIEAFAKLDHVIAQPIGLEDDVAHLDAVTADLRYDHSADWERRLSDFVLEGVPVYHSKDLLESLTGRADLEHLSENNLGSLSPTATYLLLKRILDRVVALPALIVLSPVLLIAAIAIRIDTPGPVLFKQRRTGFRGRSFYVLKFRTMTTTNTEGETRESYITQQNDARITKVGNFLRQSRIDELPQIINILRGEMSWIGPRPEAEKLSEWYEEELPFYRYRHVVMPGISGWAQVSQGHVAELDAVQHKLQLDFYYIRHFSVWLDLLIVGKTLRTMLSGFGAR